uniref:G_PROTEIN_RECEP_F1_2 domain-containing protein n=1 Tax=Caenorhabditis tropicalis TaxID=1561998 RepID=A0A1I7T5S4_9PELO
MFGRRMEADNSTVVDPVAPTYLISDYIEIAYLGLVLLFGVPANVIILQKLIKEMKMSNRDLVKSGFVMLKINLNITDLLILTYSLGKLIWLITYKWVGGDMACRLYQMFSMFSLYSSSNIVMCIALDRLRNVIYANQIHTKTNKISIVTVLAYSSWIAALICSLPQFFLFQTIEVYPNFIQCSDVWQISRHSQQSTAFFDRDSFVLSQTFENSYNIAHLVLVFWGPLIVLIVTYAVIATKLMKYSLRAPGTESVRRPMPTAADDSPKDMIVHVNVEDGLLKKEGSLKKVVKCCTEEIITKQSRRKSNKRNGGKDSTTTTSSTSTRMPTWRKQIRGRVFRTTMLVILTHFLFWFPYNALGLMKYINQGMFEILSANANIFKDLQILITLINPFLYGFSSGN